MGLWVEYIFVESLNSLCKITIQKCVVKRAISFVVIWKGTTSYVSTELCIKGCVYRKHIACYLHSYVYTEEVNFIFLYFVTYRTIDKHIHKKKQENIKRSNIKLTWPENILLCIHPVLSNSSMFSFRFYFCGIRFLVDNLIK